MIRFEVRRAEDGFMNALAVTIIDTDGKRDNPGVAGKEFSFLSATVSFDFDKLGPSVQGFSSDYFYSICTLLVTDSPIAFFPKLDEPQPQSGRKGGPPTRGMYCALPRLVVTRGHYFMCLTAISRIHGSRESAFREFLVQFLGLLYTHPKLPLPMTSITVADTHLPLFHEDFVSVLPRALPFF